MLLTRSHSTNARLYGTSGACGVREKQRGGSPGTEGLAGGGTPPAQKPPSADTAFAAGKSKPVHPNIR